MLLSYVHVVLAVWTLIRNYEAGGEGGGGGTAEDLASHMHRNQEA